MSRLLQIRASAGSGKTFTLTQKYVEKLASVTGSGQTLASSAAEILAVTFTNAAANEMRERVLKRLKNAALGNSDECLNTDLALSWLDIFFQNLDALNIRTIDSLLHQIIRASALDLGINPDYETEFDAKAALRPYVELFLEKAAQPGHERELLEKATEGLIKASDKPHFSGRSLLLNYLEESLEDTLTGAFASALTPAELEVLVLSMEETVKAKAQALLDSAASQNTALTNGYVTRIQAYVAGNYPDKPGTLLGYDTTIANLCARNARPTEELQAIYAEFRSVARLLHEFRNIVPKALLWQPFVEIAREVGEIFAKLQHEDGILPQAIVPARAKSVLEPLGPVTDTICRMGNRLLHFLVDEFQDTSDEQWAVLKALVVNSFASGGTLVWVGDPKQSIYSWRGGNYQLFDLVKTDPELLNIEPDVGELKLATNWRSSPEIVRHTNTFFKPLINVETAASILSTMLAANPAPDLVEKAAGQLAAIFKDVEQNCSGKVANPGYVACEKIVVDKKILLTGAILDQLQPLLEDIGRRRPWSDVLILVRKNDLGRQIAEFLGNLGIPVLTENGLALNEHILINQTVAFLRFLNNPEDDLAFWAALNSNLVYDHPDASDLAKADLAGLAAGRGKQKLYKAFAQQFPDLWQKLFAPFLRISAIYTPYDTVMEWYAYLSVMARFPADETMLRRFLETLHLAENQGYATIAEFLEYWDGHGQNEKAPMPAKMDAVQIMTIHKAKGLEKPVTIIPDTRFELKRMHGPAALNVMNRTVVANLNSDLGSFYQAARLKEALEELNLLYVAMTRAKEELYFFQTIVTGNKSQKTTSEAVSCMANAVQAVTPYPIGSLPKPAEKISRITPEPDTQEAVIGELDPAWRPMQWQPRLKIYYTRKRDAQLTPNERGTLLHACLENLTLGAPNSIELALMAAQRATGIVAPEHIIPDLAQTLGWFASLPQAGRWLSSAHKEQSFITPGGEIFRPDLIVPESDGPLVIDYKSGQFDNAHIGQIQGYLQNLQSSGQFAGTPKGLLIYLDLQRLVDVKLPVAA